MNTSKVIVESNGKLIIENARILYRNFSGAQTQFNHEGDRNFCVFIDSEEAASDLKEQGWNVKIRKPRDEFDPVSHYIKVNVSYRFRAPIIYMHTGKKVNNLDEETVGLLDNADIVSCDMVINPSRWSRNGENGISAYLESMHVVIREDYFADKYADAFADEAPEE